MCLRQELRPYGVGVSMIFPGRVDTPMIETLDVPHISAKVPPRGRGTGHRQGYSPAQPRSRVAGSSRLFLFTDRLSPQLSDWIVQFFRLEGWEKA